MRRRINSDPPFRILYRSKLDGSWISVDGPRDRIPIRRSKIRVWPDEQVVHAAAAEFFKEMKSRGTQVILTFVPYPGYNEELAIGLADSLNAPLIRYDGDPLFSCDAR